MPRLSPIFVALAALMAQAVAARADAVSDFYRGQTINLILGSDPGGGYDAYARPVARHLGRHIPGNPSIAVKYMPGAGSLVAANWLYNAATRDGLHIGGVQRQIPFEPLRGNDAVRYDPFKFIWLGSVTAETAVFIVNAAAPHREAGDLLKFPLIAASLGSGTDGEVETNALARLHRAPIKLISGYRGTPEALLALERGEVQGVHGISWSYIKSKKMDWLKEGKVRLLVQSGLEQHPDLPSTPQLQSLAVDDEDRQVWDLILAPKVMSRPYLLPPETPSDRSAALRSAFANLMIDPAFLEEMDKAQLEVKLATGEAIEQLMRRLYSLPPSTITKMRTAIAADGH